MKKKVDDKDTSGKNYKPDSSGSTSLWHKMAIRTAAGAAMIIAFSLTLYTGHDLLILFMMLGQAFMWKEIVSLRWKIAKEEHDSIFGFRSLQWFFLLLSYFHFYAKPFLYYYQPLIPEAIFMNILIYHGAVVFFLYVLAFLGLIFSLRKESLKYQFSQISWTFMSLLIVMGQSHFVVTNALHGMIWIVLPHSLTICNDIMAYFCGVSCGRKFIKKPLSPLSENKTWEGFLGALFFTLIFGFFFSAPLAQFDWMICPKTHYTDLVVGCKADPVFLQFNYNLPSYIASIVGSSTVKLYPLQFHSIVFALFASLIAPFGGILASGIKRAYGIKDYGNIIPGHGGVADRMDCHLIMATFVFVYVTTFISPWRMTSEVLIHEFSSMPHAEKLYVLKELQAIIAGH